MIATTRVLTDSDGLRREVAAARHRGLSVGFVPTMGALHEGHQALIGRSAAENGLTVVSVFVNPRQFGDPHDLASYPRTAEEDVEAAQAAGADVCFMPAGDEVYPAEHVTSVSIRGPLTETLEGAQRGAAHFDGVCTVLAILFSLVSPDVAYFGEKDAQQLKVVQRMVRDLQMPLRVEGVPTVRDGDGLALSSRNARLAPGQRSEALALPRALAAVGAAVGCGEVATGEEASELGLDLLARHGTVPEYFVAVQPESFAPEPSPGPSTLLLCAARVGHVRLIDNMTVEFAAATGYGVDRGREEA